MRHVSQLCRQSRDASRRAPTLGPMQSNGAPDPWSDTVAVAVRLLVRGLPYERGRSALPLTPTGQALEDRLNTVMAQTPPQDRLAAITRTLLANALRAGTPDDFAVMSGAVDAANEAVSLLAPGDASRLTVWLNALLAYLGSAMRHVGPHLYRAQLWFTFQSVMFRRGVAGTHYSRLLIGHRDPPTPTGETSACRITSLTAPHGPDLPGVTLAA